MELGVGFYWDGDLNLMHVERVLVWPVCGLSDETCKILFSPVDYFALG